MEIVAARSAPEDRIRLRSLGISGRIGNCSTESPERPIPMSQFFRIQVDTEALTDAAFEFVTDPHPSRNDRPVIHELNEFNPEVVDVLECMVMDGTEERRDVAAYITAVFGNSPL